MTNPMAAPECQFRGSIPIHGKASHEAHGPRAWRCGCTHHFIHDFVVGEIGPMFLAACRPGRAVSDLFRAADRSGEPEDEGVVDQLECDNPSG
jgi:hypothetical protein